MIRRCAGSAAGFANPEVYGFLEAERIKYAIRLPANRVLRERIGHLLARPVGRPPNEVRRSYANFTYQARSWTKPRRVVAKVEWHPGELYLRVGFIVTNMARPAENVVAFLTSAARASNGSKRARAAQSNGRGRRAVPSPPTPSVSSFKRWLTISGISCARSQRRTPIKDWSLTSPKEKLIKIGAKVVSHGRYVAFQMAEVAILKNLFADILRLVAEPRPPPDAARPREALGRRAFEQTWERCVHMLGKNAAMRRETPFPGHGLSETAPVRVEASSPAGTWNQLCRLRVHLGNPASKRRRMCRHFFEIVGQEDQRGRISMTRYKILGLVITVSLLFGYEPADAAPVTVPSSAVISNSDGLVVQAVIAGGVWRREARRQKRRAIRRHGY
jgi:hypothetical protein